MSCKCSPHPWFLSYKNEMSSGNDFSKWSCLVTIENIQSPQILCFVQWVEGRGMEVLEEEEQKVLCSIGHTWKTLPYSHCFVCILFITTVCIVDKYFFEVCVCVCVLVAQSYPTLTSCSFSGSSVHGILQARILE